MPWCRKVSIASNVHGMLRSRPPTRPAVTRVGPVAAERASQIAPTTETSRIGSALLITIGESVSRVSTARAGARIETSSSTPSHSANPLRRVMAAKISAGQHHDRDRGAVEHQLAGAADDVEEREAVERTRRRRCRCCSVIQCERSAQQR